MVSPRCSDIEYIDFLIASSHVFTCTEAPQCHPLSEDVPAHDAYTRLLMRPPPDTVALWNEVEKSIDRKNGFLVLDDSTLDKPYAKKWLWFAVIGAVNITKSSRGLTFLPLFGLTAVELSRWIFDFMLLKTIPKRKMIICRICCVLRNAKNLNPNT